MRSRCDEAGEDELAPLPATPSSLDALRASMSQCRRCPLSLGRAHVVVGEGSPTARFVVIGEGPGREEDLSGRPFVGRSGRLLRSLLGEIWPGALERGDIYLTNIVRCRPPSNRTPRRAEVQSCSLHLKSELELLAPLVIVTVGLTATRAMVGLTSPLRELRGRLIEVEGAVVVPTYHPAAALRGGKAIVDCIEADLRSAHGVVLGEGVRVQGEVRA